MKPACCSHEIAAYAIGGAAEHECLLVESHVADCAQCRELLAELDLVVDHLVVGAWHYEAPPELRASIVSSCSRTPQVSPDVSMARVPRAQPPHTRTRATWRRFLRPAALAPALAAACVVLVIGLLDARETITRLERENAAGPSAGSMRMMQLETTRELSGSELEVMVVGNDKLMLWARALPEPPPGMAWQLWAFDAEHDMEPLASVDHGDSELVMPAGELPAGAVGVGITIEPVQTLATISEPSGTMVANAEFA